MADIPFNVHRLMATQHGNVSLAQLLDSGLTRNQVKHLVRRTRLLDAGRNVYRSPSIDVTEESRCAALCLGRPGAVISGPTAGRLWGFRKMGHDRRIHILMQPHANSVRSSREVVARRTSTLAPVDIVGRSDGIRVTSRRRTCLELARSLAASDLLSVIEQAMLEGRLSETEMRDVAVGVTVGRPWVRHYLCQIDRRVSGAPAESHPEVRIGDALEAHGVRGLVRQHPLTLPGVGNVRFDLAVPDIRWAVEIDLFPTHQQTEGSAADVRRDASAASIGWEVHRVSLKDYELAFSNTVLGLVEDAAQRRTAHTRPSK